MHRGQQPCDSFPQCQYAHARGPTRTDGTRFRLARLLPQTKWEKVRVGIRSNHDYHEGRELGAFAAFCQENGVEVDVEETEWE